MKIYYHIISVGISLFSLANCNMSQLNSEVEQTLSQAGENRNELFKVIRHYQSDKDSLKLKAALFLIENMTGKLYYSGGVVDEYQAFLDSVYQIKQEEYDIPAIYEKFMNEAVFMNEPPIVLEDAKTLSAEFLIKNIDEAFTVWAKPWNEHLSFAGFCEWILPYRVGIEMVGDWRELYRKRFESLLMEDSIKTAKQACTVINNELIKLPIHIATTSVLPIDLRPEVLINIKFGLCSDYANLAVYVMRSVGIPVAIDAIPHWGNNNNGHAFNVVYDNDSAFYDFAGAEENPEEHLIRFKNSIPKIYRSTFGKQNSSLAIKRGSEDVPPFFKNAYMLDVTDDYSIIGAKNISLSLPKKTNQKFAYLCVFNPNGWTPIAWGNVEDNIVSFEGIGPNIVYQAALYVDEKLEFINEPFFLDTLGDVRNFVPSNECFDCVLERKNPKAANLAYLPPLMVGSSFQGANDLDFKDFVTFHTITDEPDFKYVTVESDNTTPVKFIRYQSSNKTRGNMAEVEFYSTDSEDPINGRIIGSYESSKYYPRYGPEMLFDNDPLTFFHSNDTASWGGLELEKPKVISKIRYIIRNDDNGVRKGHEYELFCMSGGAWKSVGKKIAIEDDKILFEQIPKGGLYWLRDYTKGREERIFEINDNKIIWH